MSLSEQWLSNNRWIHLLVDFVSQTKLTSPNVFSEVDCETLANITYWKSFHMHQFFIGNESFIICHSTSPACYICLPNDARPVGYGLYPPPLINE